MSHNSCFLNLEQRHTLTLRTPPPEQSWSVFSPDSSVSALSALFITFHSWSWFELLYSENILDACQVVLRCASTLISVKNYCQNCLYIKYSCMLCMSSGQPHFIHTWYTDMWTCMACSQYINIILPTIFSAIGQKLYRQKGDQVGKPGRTLSHVER